MIDANQQWDVDEAIARVQRARAIRPWWIEEPTSPDDVLGHATIAKAVRELGIGVATGEHCANRIVFKQLLQARAIDFCQIDSCRLGGVNENLAVILMAAKFGVPVCPHAGGVGLCEYVQHLSMFDYIAVSGDDGGSGDRVCRPPARTLRGSGRRPPRPLPCRRRSPATASPFANRRASRTGIRAAKCGHEIERQESSLTYPRVASLKTASAFRRISNDQSIPLAFDEALADAAEIRRSRSRSPSASALAIASASCRWKDGMARPTASRPI